jgi:gluconolactonase
MNRLTSRRLARTVAACLALLALALASTALSQGTKGIPGIGPAGEIVKAHTGFKFTEGPAVDADGNVYFSDIPNNRIHKIDTQGCNGLMFDGRGRLIACQRGDGRIIAIDVGTKKIEVVADKYDGKRFTGPNDLVVDAEGGVYFTDPGFKKEAGAQDKEGVYHVAPGGKVTRLIDDQPRPNGVLLSPDEKTLYVLLSGKPALMAYPIEKPGKIGAGKSLGELSAGGDGLTADTKGNLYLTQPKVSSIQVMTPQGKTLGMLKFPEGPANCCFGGKDMKTLFVTARTSVYTVRMEATGHRFGAGK